MQVFVTVYYTLASRVRVLFSSIVLYRQKNLAINIESTTNIQKHTFENYHFSVLYTSKTLCKVIKIIRKISIHKQTIENRSFKNKYD